MKKAKFAQILSSLSPDEFKQFGKFLKSPIYNSNKKIIKLYQILKSSYPDFNDKSYNTENIFRKLYPNLIFNEKKLRNLSSDMLGLSKKYLSYIGYINDWFIEKRLLIKELEFRNHENIFKHEVAISLKKIASVNIKGHNDIYNEFLIWEMVNNYYKSRESRKNIGDAEKELNYFLNFVIGNLFRLYINMMTEETYLQINYKFPLLNETLLLVQNNTGIYKDSVDIQIQYNRLMLKITKNINYYNVLKKFLIQKKNKTKHYYN